MNSIEFWKRLPLCGALALVLGAGAAGAAMRGDVAADISVNEDTRIFLNVTNQVWHPPAPAMLIRSCRFPASEFPVVAFLAYHSRRDPADIMHLRNEGYPWYEVMFRLKMDPAVLFLGIDRDPGPPYGRAWGQWNQYRHAGGRGRFRCSNGDFVELVKLQTVSRHFGASAASVVKVRHQGQRMEAYAATRWREKHHRQTWSEDEGESRGQGRGQKGRNGDSREKGVKDSEGKDRNHGDEDNR